MKQQLQNWKSLSVIACTLALSASLQASAPSQKVTLRATDPTALEGTTAGAFTLIRTGDTTTALNVSVAISGTASNGVDYVPIATVITLPVGALAVDIPVTPLIDNVNRGNKSVVLTVQSNVSYTIGGNPVAVVRIIDDVFNIPPPSVSMSSPADGTVITSPATLHLVADASDPELAVQSVSFYANDDFVGRVTNSPYALTLTGVRPGVYSIFARAVDQFGKSAVSTPVNVTVSATPVVTLLTPDDTTFVLGQPAALLAQIGDPNESIKSVTFTINNKVVGVVTNAPFAFSWPTRKTGTFTAQATAIDKNTGRQGTSAKVTLTVINGGGQ